MKISNMALSEGPDIRTEADEDLEKFNEDPVAYFSATLLRTGQLANLIMFVDWIAQKKGKKEEALLSLAEERAVTDNLTGLYNRGYFDSALNEMKEQIDHARSRIAAGGAQRKIGDKASSTFSVIILDIDHFKNVNDTYGHPTGDLAIKELARILKEKVSVRDKLDTIARYGGEEFVILLKGVSAKDAGKIVKERIIPALESIEIAPDCDSSNDDFSPFKLHISAGVAEYDPSHMDTGIDITKRADIALYFSKQNGRNQVNVWNENEQVQAAVEKYKREKKSGDGILAA